MAKTRSLVATDSRPPLTMALGEAFSAELFSPELLTQRKLELSALVVQAAKTFGFQSKTSVAQALDLTVGLLSLALAASTRGETLPLQWADLLVRQSWPELLKESIAMVRSVKDTDENHAYFFEGEKDPQALRDHLRDFALRRDKNRQWVGYTAFSNYREDRLHHQTLDKLIRYLIKTLLKRSLPRSEPGEGPANAEEALNTLLFRSCTGLGFAPRDIMLTEKEVRQVRKDYDAAPAKWLKEGQSRYELLQLGVPENLLAPLSPDWFQKHFEKGPPKVKQWESDDIPGITGFYYYQTFL